ncbi:hypothetical protein IJ182_07780 [bacterium]|nr:hypothetical protein [bacterium]
MINILPVRQMNHNFNINFGRKNKPNLNSKKHDIYSRRNNQNSKKNLDFYGYNDIVIINDRIQSMEEIEKKEETYLKLSKAIAGYDFNAIISSLINNNQFSDSNIYLSINNKDSFAKLSIVLPENTDDDKIDNFVFSIDEFKELIFTLKQHVSHLYPEYTKEYEENTAKLLNKLKNIK